MVVVVVAHEHVRGLEQRAAGAVVAEVRVLDQYTAGLPAQVGQQRELGYRGLGASIWGGQTMGSN